MDTLSTLMFKIPMALMGHFGKWSSARVACVTQVVWKMKTDYQVWDSSQITILVLNYRLENEGKMTMQDIHNKTI